jgi:hypothetical protein
MNDEFAWSQRRDEVVISQGGRPVTVLRRSAALRFLERVQLLDAEQAQQLMARATGNFKRGNERREPQN